MIKIKSRKQKAKIYESKYSDIPRDYYERLNWMYDKFHITESKADIIYNTKNQMLNAIQYSQEYFVILYEEPEGIFSQAAINP